MSSVSSYYSALSPDSPYNERLRVGECIEKEMEVIKKVQEALRKGMERLRKDILTTTIKDGKSYTALHSEITEGEVECIVQDLKERSGTCTGSIPGVNDYDSESEADD